MSTRITHPVTGKTVVVDVFPVDYRETLLATKGVKIHLAQAIGFHILGSARSMARMEQQMGGEGRHDNAGLRAIENALDWALGLAFIAIVRAYKASGRSGRPKPFELLATRTGAILVRWASGQIDPISS